MICQVIIYDFEIARRMVYVLDDDDFVLQERRWDQTDPLLATMQSNPFFAGKTRWCDLDVIHFHVLILNILKILATLRDSQRSEKHHPAVLRLTFFICGLVSLLQQRSQSLIELLRIKRLARDDLIYDYSATLDVTTLPSPAQVAAACSSSTINLQAAPPDMTDIDIDFADRELALAGLTHVAALEIRNAQRVRHLCGVYFHDVPIDPLDGMAAWDYETTAAKGYFKIDFINNTVYRGVRDEAHLDQLLATDPPWDAFNEPTIVGNLVHIHNHFNIVQMIRPRSIVDLAVCLALPRRGKRYLIGRPRVEIDRDIWKPTSEFYFKKPHAISYGALIVVQLNLLVERCNDAAY